MKQKILFIVFFSFIISLFSNEIVHQVEKKESLSLIALNYTNDSGNYKKIAKMNNIKNINKVPVGYKIKISKKLLHLSEYFKVPDGLNFHYYYKIGEGSYKKENYFKASGYFYKAFVLEKNNASIYNYLLSLYKLNRYKKIIEEYNRYKFKSAKIFYLLGLSHKNINQLDKTVEFLKKSITFSPEYFLPYKSLSIIYKKIGKSEEAENIIKKFGQLND